MSEPAHVRCFTDVLCGHSYFAHARFEQLAKEFGNHVRLTFHFRSTYADVRRRMTESGKSAREYNALLRAAAERFDGVKVHREVFLASVPSSSTPAHLYLRAVKLLEDEGELGGGRSRAFERLLREVQVAFFRDSIDVSRRSELDRLAERLGIPPAGVARAIDDGRAHAELDHDAKVERRFSVQMSPALVLDDGRQVLNGDVGYGVMSANVRELVLGAH